MSLGARLLYRDRVDMTPRSYRRDHLTALRDRAHRTFDRIWIELGGAITQGDDLTRRRQKAKKRIWRRQRTAAYAWLADQLDLPSAHCHFGKFDEPTLLRVIELVEHADHDAVRRYKTTPDRAES